VTGTGTLVVSVNDTEGRPLGDASVTVFNRNQTKTLSSQPTDPGGRVTVGSLPTGVRVSVLHDFAENYHTDLSSVAQGSSTVLPVTLQAVRPKPTAALLPVRIPVGGVSADRRELLLQVTVVASAQASFRRAEFGDGSSGSTPSLGLALGEWDADGNKFQCRVWLDRTRTLPSCGQPSGESPYTVTVEEFSYDPTGRVPALAAPGHARSVMLLLDQSERVGSLDPLARRSYAARRFVERTLAEGAGRSLAVYGFAGPRTEPVMRSSLPQQPLWSPLASAATFSSDPGSTSSAVGTLEPLIGGGAPVFDALQAALTLTATQAAPGGRAVVALLGGGDDDDASESSRRLALTALRRQRDDSGIQPILVSAAPDSRPAERLAVARLATALRAPTIMLGQRNGANGYASQRWTSSSFAALDLAGDLVDGVPLPTLSATFRIRIDAGGTFASGALLQGALFLESELCQLWCAVFPLEFAAEVP
jgi:hypothetical protein